MKVIPRHLRSFAIALGLYALLISAAFIGLAIMILKPDTPPTNDRDLSLCGLPAVSRQDLHPAADAPNKTPCDALPAGLILVCRDQKPREHLLDCPIVDALIVR